MAFAESGVIGIDFTKVVAGSGSSSDEGNEFALGSRARAKDGQEYIYVHAATAITVYDAVGIDENYEASALTKAMADDGWMIGFAQTAVADNEFAWVAKEGSNITVSVLTSCAADVSLYTSGTAGKLDDTSASQTKINGVTAVAAATSGTSPVECIAISPYPELAA